MQKLFLQQNFCYTKDTFLALTDMISPKLKNQLTKTPHTAMRPVHLRLSEEVILRLEETAKEHGFKQIQGLIRLYVRQGLDRDNAHYSLANDVVFLQKLKRKGVSQKIIDEALIDTNT